jgi:hypothetical protein
VQPTTGHIDTSRLSKRCFSNTGALGSGESLTINSMTTINTFRAYTQLTGRLHPDTLYPVVRREQYLDDCEWVTLQEYHEDRQWALWLSKGFAVPETVGRQLSVQTHERLQQFLKQRRLP